MKRLSFLVIVASLFACQSKTNNHLSQQEREKLKGEFESLVDQIIQSYNSQEINTVFLNYKDFKYGIPGRILDYNQFKGIYAEFFEKVKTQTYRKVKGDLSFADSDFAIYSYVTALRKKDWRNNE